MKRTFALPSALILALVVSLVPGQGAAQSPAAEADIVTAPVELDGRVLFRVRGASSLPAETRAATIRERLIAVAANRNVSPDSIRVVADENATRIVAGDTSIVTLVDADGDVEQMERSSLAAAHAQRIQQAVRDYRDARSTAALRGDALRALAATGALVAGVVALVWLRRRADDALTRKLESRIHSVGIQSFEVLRAERIWTALRSLMMTVQTILLLAMAVVFLGYVLAQFPWTRAYSQDMTSFALRPLQVIGSSIAASVPSLVFLAVLYYIVRFIVRLTRLFFEAVEHGRVTLTNFDREWSQPTYKIVRIAIVAFGLIVAYPYIPGSESDAFKGVSIFIGVLFSLGSSSAISNIIAGYMMTYRRAFKVGDRIKVGDAVGEVIEMRLQVTHLRSPKNEEIIIPNSEILSGEVINYSSLAKTRGLILHTQVGIGYQTPWRQVEAMLLMAAERTEGLLREPKPFVLLRGLGEFAVTYELNAYFSNVPQMVPTYAEMHRHILDVFNEFGVQIMTPAYEGDPEIPKVVAQADWFTEPAARPAEAAAAAGAPAGTTSGRPAAAP